MSCLTPSISLHRFYVLMISWTFGMHEPVLRLVSITHHLPHVDPHRSPQLCARRQLTAPQPPTRRLCLASGDEVVVACCTDDEPARPPVAQSWISIPFSVTFVFPLLFFTILYLGFSMYLVFHVMGSKSNYRRLLSTLPNIFLYFMFYIQEYIFFFFHKVHSHQLKLYPCHSPNKYQTRENDERKKKLVSLSKAGSKAGRGSSAVATCYDRGA